MKKRILNFLLALSVALSAALATAPASKAEVYSGYCGDTVRWSFDDSTGELKITGTGEMDSYIPSDEEFGVYYDSITSVYIGSGVEDVSGMQCWLMDKLEEISVDSSNSHYYSDSDGVLYDKNKTELFYFPQASELQSYEVPEGVEVIGEEAFWSCDNLVCVELPYSVRRIEGDAFGFFGTFATAPNGIEIPSTVDEIADDAFGTSHNVEIYYTGSESDWENIDIFKHYSPDEDSTLDLENVTVYYNSYMDAESMVKAVNDELNPPQTSNTVAGLVILDLLIGAVLFAIGYSIVKKYKESNAK